MNRNTTQNKRKAPSSAWKPGQSGNPAGRTPGHGEVAKLRAGIAQHLPEILTKQVELAKAGDAQAARLLLDRVLPPVKATEQPAPINFPVEGSLTEQGRAVLQAAGVGELSPAQAAQLLSSLASMARLVETDELAARVAALESKATAGTAGQWEGGHAKGA